MKVCLFVKLWHSWVIQGRGSLEGGFPKVADGPLNLVHWSCRILWRTWVIKKRRINGKSNKPNFIQLCRAPYSEESHLLQSCLFEIFMIRFLNYISIVFRKAASAFDLSLFTALFSVVTSCFCRNSGSLAMSSPQPMNLTSTKADYEMPLTPASAVFPLSWNYRDSSVLKSFVRFSDISKLQFVLQTLLTDLQRTDQRQLM